MFPDLHGVIEAHAMKRWPQEICGAVLESGMGLAYRPLSDVADNSRIGFRIAEAALCQLEEEGGRLLAVVHGHASTERGKADSLLFTPSAAEMRSQAVLALPFGIVVCDGERCSKPFWFGDQCPVPPLLRRPFRHGVTDCYSLIRDWYRLERNILLPDYPRDWNWWLVKGRDMYLKGFRQAGFRVVDRARPRRGDGILFRIRSDTPNHAAVMLDQRFMLHHPSAMVPYDPFRVSHRQIIDDRWRRFITHWVRHESET